MKEQNLILLLALVVANLMSDKIKPLVDNMVGKLVLVLTVCYLANKHIILGLWCSSLHFCIQWST